MELRVHGRGTTDVITFKKGTEVRNSDHHFKETDRTQLSKELVDRCEYDHPERLLYLQVPFPSTSANQSQRRARFRISKLCTGSFVDLMNRRATILKGSSPLSTKMFIFLSESEAPPVVKSGNYSADLEWKPRREGRERGRVRRLFHCPLTRPII